MKTAGKNTIDFLSRYCRNSQHTDCAGAWAGLGLEIQITEAGIAIKIVLKNLVVNNLKIKQQSNVISYYKYRRKGKNRLLGAGIARTIAPNSGNDFALWSRIHRESH